MTFVCLEKSLPAHYIPRAKNVKGSLYFDSHKSLIRTTTFTTCCEKFHRSHWKWRRAAVMKNLIFFCIFYRKLAQKISFHLNFCWIEKKKYIYIYIFFFFISILSMYTLSGFYITPAPLAIFPLSIPARTSLSYSEKKSMLAKRSPIQALTTRRVAWQVIAGAIYRSCNYQCWFWKYIIRK